MLQLAERTPFEAINSAQAALLRPEEDNVRAALTWAIRHDQAELGLRLATATYPVWLFSGHFAEGTAWFDRLLALPTAAAAPAARCLALVFDGQLRTMLGDYAVAQAHGLEALEEARTRADKLGTALALEMLGNVALPRGDLAQAGAFHADSARLKRELGGRRLVSNLLQLGHVANEVADTDRIRSAHRGDRGDRRSAAAAARTGRHTAAPSTRCGPRRCPRDRRRAPRAGPRLASCPRRRVGTRALAGDPWAHAPRPGAVCRGAHRLRRGDATCTRFRRAHPRDPRPGGGRPSAGAHGCRRRGGTRGRIPSPAPDAWRRALAKRATLSGRLAS